MSVTLILTRLTLTSTLCGPMGDWERLPSFISDDLEVGLTLRVKISFNSLLLCIGSTPPIHLGRDPLDQCASSPIMCARCDPFVGQRMELPEDTTLRVHIGPAAGERGYAGITGV